MDQYLPQFQVVLYKEQIDQLKTLLSGTQNPDLQTLLNDLNTENWVTLDHSEV